jgi:hypothetical protein
MNRKLMTIVVLCLLAMATGAFAFNSRLHLTASAPAAGRASGNDAPVARADEASPAAMITRQFAGSTQEPNAQIPETVIYRQLFRHIDFVKGKAEEKDKNGEDGSALRSFYKRQAKLNDKQTRDLEAIAAECNAAVDKLDKKARKLMDDFRARHPGGKLAEGELPPPPPAELGLLQEERNNTILQARTKLRDAFGQQEFERFNEYVKRGIVPNIKPVKMNPSTVRMPDELRHQPRK